LVKPDRLGLKRILAIRSRYNEVFYSSASIWELALGNETHKIVFPFAPEAVAEAAVKTGFIELPIRSDAAALVATLPPHHDDLFDRILIAQAMTEPARFLTTDPELTRYSDVVEIV
jgi:PIN domain nuclease of toxin-antitoxin system